MWRSPSYALTYKAAAAISAAFSQMPKSAEVDDVGREHGCLCALIGPAASPRIAEIDSRCPLHGDALPGWRPL
jgi:hypothetical protein